MVKNTTGTMCFFGSFFSLNIVWLCIYTKHINSQLLRDSVLEDQLLTSTAVAIIWIWSHGHKDLYIWKEAIAVSLKIAISYHQN